MCTLRVCMNHKVYYFYTPTRRSRTRHESATNGSEKRRARMWKHLTPFLTMIRAPCRVRGSVCLLVPTKNTHKSTPTRLCTVYKYAINKYDNLKRKRADIIQRIISAAAVLVSHHKVSTKFVVRPTAFARSEFVLLVC